jgi:hypothetical protein
VQAVSLSHADLVLRRMADPFKTSMIQEYNLLGTREFNSPVKHLSDNSAPHLSVQCTCSVQFGWPTYKRPEGSVTDSLLLVLTTSGHDHALRVALFSTYTSEEPPTWDKVYGYLCLLTVQRSSTMQEIDLVPRTVVCHLVVVWSLFSIGGRSLRDWSFQILIKIGGPIKLAVS